MAYSKQTWVDGVTPVDAAHMSHIEDGIAAAIVGKATISPAAGGPPAAPANGDTWYATDVDAANGTTRWMFHYSTPNGTWYFVGGAPIAYAIDTWGPGAADGTWRPCSGALTIPRPGRYTVEGFATFQPVAANGVLILGVTINGTGRPIAQTSQAAAGPFHNPGGKTLATFAAGDQVRLAANITGGGSPAATLVGLFVTPLFVT